MNTIPLPVLEAKSISKKFGNIQANENIHFDLRKGEIHAILGENGAGKSTLMNILSGLYRPDQGEIYIHGNHVAIRRPKDAIRLGIHMVHQHFMLIPTLSVIENIILGNEPVKRYSLNLNRAKKWIQNIMSDNGLYFDLDACIQDLSVSIQQRVEIIKGLYRDAEILLLDEPTSTLSPQEVQDFFAMLKRLSKKSISIVFISHKLKEAMSISDRITIIRRGRIIDTTTPDKTNEARLAQQMVGRNLSKHLEKPKFTSKRVVLEVHNLSVSNDRGMEAVRDVSFRIHDGEILGIAGVQGNGQSELAEALSGLRSIRKGSIRLNGYPIDSKNPRKLYEHGMGHIPEDRMKYALVAPYSIADNQVLRSYYKPPFAGKIRRNIKSVIAHSNHLINRFNIHAPGPETPVITLSGGNQQKVVLSRELSQTIRFLLANQPTRGLDVGSIEFTYSQFVELRNNGAAILLISNDLDEILTLADRIAVIYEGRINMISPVEKITKNDIGLYMTGEKAQI